MFMMDDTVISVSDDEDHESESEDNDDDAWNDEEVLKRVIELSKLDTGSEIPVENEEEKENLKKALELSLRCEPLLNVTSDESEDSDIATIEQQKFHTSNVPFPKVQKLIEKSSTDHEKIGGAFSDLAGLENHKDNVSFADANINDFLNVTESKPEKVQPFNDCESVIIVEETENALIETGSSTHDDHIEDVNEIPTGTKSLVLDGNSEPDSSVLKVEQQISNEEISKRLMLAFESSLSIHLAGEEKDACNAICTKLFHHQKLALNWMIEHENNANDGMRGGILAGKNEQVRKILKNQSFIGQSKVNYMYVHMITCLSLQSDDMGLGKTLTVIALILTNFWDNRPLTIRKQNYVRPNFSCQKRENLMKRTRLDSFSSDSDNEESVSSSSKTTFISRKRRKKENTSKDYIYLKYSDSEDEFDEMSKQMSLSEKLNIGSPKTFQKVKNPLSDMVFYISDQDSDQSIYVESIEDQNDKKKKKSLNPKLNFDGMAESASSDDGACEPIISLFSKDIEKDTNISSTSMVEDRFSKFANEIFYSDSEVNAPNSPIKKNCDKPSSTISDIKELSQIKKRRTTLIVCPTSLISHWIEQLQTHIHKNVQIRIKIHHGQSKAVTSSELSTADIVITTYGTLTCELEQDYLSPLIRSKDNQKVFFEKSFLYYN